MDGENSARNLGLNGGGNTGKSRQSANTSFVSLNKWAVQMQSEQLSKLVQQFGGAVDQAENHADKAQIARKSVGQRIRKSTATQKQYLLAERQKSAVSAKQQIRKDVALQHNIKYLIKQEMRDINAKRKKELEDTEKGERCFKYLQTLNSTLVGQPSKKVGPSKIFRDNVKINRRKQPLIEQKREQLELRESLRESLKEERDELFELAARTGFLDQNKMAKSAKLKQNKQARKLLGSLRDQYSKNMVNDPLPLSSSESEENSSNSEYSQNDHIEVNDLNQYLKTQQNLRYLSPRKSSENHLRITSHDGRFLSGESKRNSTNNSSSVRIQIHNSANKGRSSRNGGEMFKNLPRLASQPNFDHNSRNNQRELKKNTKKSIKKFFNGGESPKKLSTNKEVSRVRDFDPIAEMDGPGESTLSLRRQFENVGSSKTKFRPLITIESSKGSITPKINRNAVHSSLNFAEKSKHNLQQRENYNNLTQRLHVRSQLELSDSKRISLPVKAERKNGKQIILLNKNNEKHENRNTLMNNCNNVSQSLSTAALTQNNTQTLTSTLLQGSTSQNCLAESRNSMQNFQNLKGGTSSAGIFSEKDRSSKLQILQSKTTQQTELQSSAKQKQEGCFLSRVRNSIMKSTNSPQKQQSLNHEFQQQKHTTNKLISVQQLSPRGKTGEDSTGKVRFDEIQTNQVGGRGKHQGLNSNSNSNSTKRSKIDLQKDNKHEVGGKGRRQSSLGLISPLKTNLNSGVGGNKISSATLGSTGTGTGQNKMMRNLQNALSKKITENMNEMQFKVVEQNYQLKGYLQRKIDGSAKSKHEKQQQGSPNKNQITETNLAKLANPIEINSLDQRMKHSSTFKINDEFLNTNHSGLNKGKQIGISPQKSENGQKPPAFLRSQTRIDLKRKPKKEDSQDKRFFLNQSSRSTSPHKSERKDLDCQKSENNSEENFQLAFQAKEVTRKTENIGLKSQSLVIRQPNLQKQPQEIAKRPSFLGGMSSSRNSESQETTESNMTPIKTQQIRKLQALDVQQEALLGTNKEMKMNLIFMARVRMLHSDLLDWCHKIVNYDYDGLIKNLKEHAKGSEGSKAETLVVTWALKQLKGENKSINNVEGRLDKRISILQEISDSEDLKNINSNTFQDDFKKDQRMIKINKVQALTYEIRKIRQVQSTVIDTSLQTIQKLFESFIRAYMHDRSVLFQNKIIFYCLIKCESDLMIELRDLTRTIQAQKTLRSFCKLWNLRRQEMWAAEQLGISYRVQQSHEIAVDYFKLQMSLAWELEDKENELKSYENMSVEYFYLGNLQKAKLYHERVLRGNIERQNSQAKVANKLYADYQRKYLPDVFGFSQNQVAKSSKNNGQSSGGEDYRQKQLTNFGEISLFEQRAAKGEDQKIVEQNDAYRRTMFELRLANDSRPTESQMTFNGDIYDTNFAATRFGGIRSTKGMDLTQKQMELNRRAARRNFIMHSAEEQKQIRRGYEPAELRGKVQLKGKPSWQKEDQEGASSGALIKTKLEPVEELIRIKQKAASLKRLRADQPETGSNPIFYTHLSQDRRILWSEKDPVQQMKQIGQHLSMMEEFVWQVVRQTNQEQIEVQNQTQKKFEGQKSVQIIKQLLNNATSSSSQTTHKNSASTGQTYKHPT